MNYILSVYANRVTGVNNVELHCCGKPIKTHSEKFTGGNIKENILRCLHRGLRFAAATVSHDDKLYIEVQNTHLVNWLMGRTEYRGYDEWLDIVFQDVEQVDCIYKYLFEANPKAKKATTCCLIKPNSKEETIDLESMMQEFEG